MRNAILCALEEKLKEDGNMPPDYKQFADDVTSAKAFHQLLNSLHPSIEFTMEIQDNKPLFGFVVKTRWLPDLNLRVQKINGHELITTLHGLTTTLPKPCGYALYKDRNDKDDA